METARPSLAPATTAPNWSATPTPILTTPTPVRTDTAAGAEATNAPDPCQQTPTVPSDLPRSGQHILKESNSPLTNANDKVDLDTGEPGHGPQLQGPWSPARAGRLADLVVEHTEVHSGCRSPLMLLAREGTAPTVAACRAALAARPGALTGSIPFSELEKGSVICMQTDEGLIAAVKVVRLLTTTYPTTLTIDTVVDRP